MDMEILSSTSHLDGSLQFQSIAKTGAEGIGYGYFG